MNVYGVTHRHGVKEKGGGASNDDIGMPSVGLETVLRAAPDLQTTSKDGNR